MELQFGSPGTEFSLLLRVLRIVVFTLLAKDHCSKNNMYIKKFNLEKLRARFFIHHSGIRMVGAECIRSVLFILPLGAEWMEWHSVHSGIGIRNRKTRAFYILAILIPEL